MEVVFEQGGEAEDGGDGAFGGEFGALVVEGEADGDIEEFHLVKEFIADGDGVSRGPCHGGSCMSFSLFGGRGVVDVIQGVALIRDVG